MPRRDRAQTSRCFTDTPHDTDTAPRDVEEKPPAGPAPHDTAPHDTAPHDTAPHDTAPLGTGNRYLVCSGV